MPTNDSPSDAAARTKTDEDDHDLLTFGEVGERLRLEVKYAEDAVAELKTSGDSARLVAAESRLIALRTAAQRNSAQPINDANFEKFFGYAGKAKQNLPTPPTGE